MKHTDTSPSPKPPELCCDPDCHALSQDAIPVELRGARCQLSGYLLPSLADLLFSVTLLALFFQTHSGLLGDGDTGYHIRAGQFIISTLTAPRLDIFSFHTPPLPWTAHEWLSEVIMAGVYDLGGLTGVVAFFAILLSCTMPLLFVTLRSRGAQLLPAAVLTLFALSASQIHWLARPHAFSFLLMIGWHHLLESWQRGGGNRLYLLPASMLLWVNLHGGFLGGFILLGAYLVENLAGMLTQPRPSGAPPGEKFSQLCLVTGACLIASLCNPNGYRILLFPFRLVSDRFVMDHVTEFLSPNFHEGQPFKYLVLLLIAVFALSRRRVGAGELVLVLVFTNMALYSARYIPLFALIMAPILTRRLGTGEGATGPWARFFRRRSDNLSRMDARAAGYLWPAAALVAVSLAGGSGRVQHSFDPKLKPVAAVEFLLREKISGNMFNNDEFGDYLIYRTYPHYRVFIDGRLDMYGAKTMKEYLKITSFGQGWESVLEKYRITWIIFDADSPFSRLLMLRQDWKLIYSDQVANIFVKDIPAHRHLIDKYSSVKPAVIEDQEDAAK